MEGCLAERDDTKYLQCSLERRVGDKVQNQVSGIPRKYAVAGNVLKLKGEDGWKVLSVGLPVHPYSPAVARRHRENTGDALPK